ncbi:MAG: hypothetical protein HFI86_06345 [Bacilli bacterium]|nr:hypothetical protein [Bacilli bacterium]
MIKKILLAPFMFIYKLIVFLLSNFWYGFLVICYGIYFLVSGFFKLITFPIRFLFKKANHSEKQLLRQEKERTEKLSKLQKVQEKQREKERKYLQEQERIAAKKREKDEEGLYLAKREKKKFGDVLNDFITSIVSIPKNIKKKNDEQRQKQLERKNLSKQVLLIDFDGEDAVKSSEKQIYEYVAKDKEGKIIKGYFDAFSKVEVHSFLLNEGYEVYSIRTSKWIKLFHSNYSSNRVKIKTKDLIFFLTQLSTYIKAGIPLVDSLQILSRQYKQKSYQRIFRSMMYDLTMGENFSVAMEKQGVAFPKLLINMVRASEMTGELPEALDDMEQYYTEAEATRKQMITALTYPSIVFVIAIGVMTFIMIYIVPKFVEIYDTMDSAQIPVFTVAVMKISDFLQNNVIWIMIAIVIIIILLKWLYDNVKAIRTAMQTFAMKLPVFGNIIIYNEVTMFTKTFASLLKHNVFITDSMEILNKITNNEVYKNMILDTISNLAKGEKISLAFNNQWAFPIPAYEMIVTGERTGQLPEMMSKVSSYYQEQHRNAVTRVKAFIEPALIIFLTIGVGFIILSIVIPMFNMYNEIQ